MTQKINGAVYPGVFVEKHVAFVKLTFNTDISAYSTIANMTTQTGTAVTGTVSTDSTFGIVESAVVNAVKMLQSKATVLGMSRYNASAKTIDVMVGYAEGYFSDANGLITASPLPITAVVNANVTSATGSNVTVGTLVKIAASTFTVSMSFSTMDGTMPAATLANGDLSIGPGANPGSPGVPDGGQGYYPYLSSRV